MPNLIEDEDGYCEIEDIRNEVDVPKLILNDSRGENTSARIGSSGDASFHIMSSSSVSNAEADVKDFLQTESDDNDEQNTIVASETNEGSLDNMVVELTSEMSHMELNDAYDSASQVCSCIYFVICNFFSNCYFSSIS